MSFDVNIHVSPIRVEVPALDRLCDVLQARGALPESIPTSVSFTARTPAVESKPAQEYAEPTPVSPVTTAERKEAPKPAVDLHAIMVATRELCKDAEKKATITGALFTRFNIKQLSQLTDGQLEEFADAIRKLGANI